MATNYGGYELYHHGILGQKWGKLNGPPYPLGSDKHSKSERKAGWRKSLGGGRNEELYERKRKLVLSDKAKKYIKVGLAVAGTALVAYGGYKLYKNVPSYYKNLGKKNVDFIRKSGKFDYLNEKAGNAEGVGLDSFITEKAKAISEQTGLALKKAAMSPKEDLEILRSNRIKGDPRYDNDCGPLAINFVLRRLGLDVVSVGMDESQQGGLSLAELGRYFKGIAKRAESVSMDSTKTQKEYVSAIRSIIEKQCGGDDSCSGLVQLFSERSNHFTTWYKENGKIYFEDIQSGIDDYVSRVNYSMVQNIVVARMDDLEVKTNNLLGSKVDFDIKQITKNR